MGTKRTTNYYLQGATERRVIVVASAGAILSAVTMIWSRSVGVGIGFVTLLPYSGYRIAQLALRPASRKETVRMILAICIAAITVLNAFGLGQQIRFLLVLFAVEVWLYYRKTTR